MKRNWSGLFLTSLAAVMVLSAAAGVGQAQTTINGSRTITGTWDASGAARTMPAKSGTTPPASCAVGEVFFKTDATAGQNWLLCTAANTWTTAGAGGGGSTVYSQSPATYVHDWDDFISGGTATLQVGKLGWHLSASSAGYTNQQTISGMDGNPGIFTISTSAAANNVAILASGGVAQTQIDQRRMFDITAIVATDNGVGTVARVGLHCSNESIGTVNPVGGIWLESDSAANTTANWFAVTKNGAANRTAVDMGVAPLGVNGGFQRFRLRRVDAGTVAFSVNGGAEQMVTTNLPGVNYYGCNSVMLVSNTDAAVKSMRVDYFSLLVTGLGR